MSFYLILQPRAGGSSVDVAHVDSVLRSIPHVTAHQAQDAIEYCYHNPNTGVHFTFEFKYPCARSERLTDEATPISFDLNLARPSFFALEAMPIVAAVAETLNLVIVDPQNDGVTPHAPLHVVAADLLRSWEQSNKWAIGILRSRQGADLAYYPRRKANYLWSWAYFRPEIDRKYAGLKVAVPRIFTMRRNGKRRLFTAISWPEHAEGLLIPAVDAVLIGQKMLGRLEPGVQAGEVLIARQTLLRYLSFGLKRVDDPVPHWRYVANDSTVSRRLAALAQLPLRLAAGLQMVSPDGFVDVPPQSNDAARRELISLISMN